MILSLAIVYKVTRLIGLLITPEHTMSVERRYGTHMHHNYEYFIGTILAVIVVGGNLYFF